MTNSSLTVQIAITSNEKLQSQFFHIRSQKDITNNFIIEDTFYVAYISSHTTGWKICKGNRDLYLTPMKPLLRNGLCWKKAFFHSVVITERANALFS